MPSLLHSFFLSKNGTFLPTHFWARIGFIMKNVEFPFRGLTILQNKL